MTDIQTSKSPTQPVPGADRGRLISTFPERPDHRWSVLFIVGTSCALVSLADGLWALINGYTKFDVHNINDWAQPWILLSLLALSAICLLLVAFLSRKPRFFSIYQNGLSWRLSNQPERFLKWDEIAGIAAAFTQEHFLTIPLRMRYQARLYPLQGTPIELRESLDRLPELITRLKASLYPRLLPRLQMAWKNGEWLSFGALSISPQFLRLAEPLPPDPLPDQIAADDRWRQVPWEQVKSLSVKSGFLVVELHNAGKNRIPVSQIPNFELLLQLVQQGVAP